MHSTYLSELNELSPILCWLLARNGRTPKTMKQIAKESGLGIKRVYKICRLTSFKTCTVAEADAFRIACGCGRNQVRGQKAYLARTLDLSQVKHGLSHFRKRQGRVKNAMVEQLKKTPLPEWLARKLAGRLG